MSEPEKSGDPPTPGMSLEEAKAAVQKHEAYFRWYREHVARVVAPPTRAEIEQALADRRTRSHWVFSEGLYRRPFWPRTGATEDVVGELTRLACRALEAGLSEQELNELRAGASVFEWRTFTVSLDWDDDPERSAYLLKRVPHEQGPYAHQAAVAEVNWVIHQAQESSSRQTTAKARAFVALGWLMLYASIKPDEHRSEAQRRRDESALDDRRDDFAELAEADAWRTLVALTHRRSRGDDDLRFFEDVLGRVKAHRVASRTGELTPSVSRSSTDAEPSMSADSKKKEKDAIKGPEVKTIKRLFAVSGNQCAFTGCKTTLVDPSGKVTGRICHVKGRNPGAKRYDETQTSRERHGFANLLLMCPIHHDVIDDDEVTYTVARLTEMKSAHESRFAAGAEPSDEMAQGFLVHLDMSTTVVQSATVASQGQSGGQTAHTIINIHMPSPPTPPPSSTTPEADTPVPSPPDLHVLQYDERGGENPRGPFRAFQWWRLLLHAPALAFRSIEPSFEDAFRDAVRSDFWHDSNADFDNHDRSSARFTVEHREANLRFHRKWGCWTNGYMGMAATLRNPNMLDTFSAADVAVDMTRFLRLVARRLEVGRVTIVLFFLPGPLRVISEPSGAFASGSSDMRIAGVRR